MRSLLWRGPRGRQSAWPREDPHVLAWGVCSDLSILNDFRSDLSDCRAQDIPHSVPIDFLHGSVRILKLPKDKIYNQGGRAVVQVLAWAMEFSGSFRKLLMDGPQGHRLQNMLINKTETFWYKILEFHIRFHLVGNIFPLSWIFFPYDLKSHLTLLNNRVGRFLKLRSL